MKETHYGNTIENEEYIVGFLGRVILPIWNVNIREIER